MGFKDASESSSTPDWCEKVLHLFAGEAGFEGVEAEAVAKRFVKRAKDMQIIVGAVMRPKIRDVSCKGMQYAQGDDHLF